MNNESKSILAFNTYEYVVMWQIVMMNMWWVVVEQ